MLLAFLGQAWILAVLYLVWLYGDKGTPQAGGCQSTGICNWVIWRHFLDYFILGSIPRNSVLNWAHGFRIDSSKDPPQMSKLTARVECVPSVPQLVKTTELDPSHNYLFGFHLLGILVAGAFGNFCTEATGFSSLFPGLRPHLLMLPCRFHFPLFWDYIMCSGEEGGAPPQDLQFLLSPLTPI